MNSPEPRPEQSPESEKQGFLAKLKELRYNWVDDIPAEMVETEDPLYNHYKCRVVFFSVVSGFLELSVENNYFKGEDLKAAEDFIDFVRREIKFGKRVVKEDIEKANAILDKAISALSQ